MTAPGLYIGQEIEIQETADGYLAKPFSGPIALRYGFDV